MKRYNREQEQTKVGRVTSVFEPDTDQNDILSRYSEAEIVDRKLKESQQSDIDSLLQQFPDVLTKEPGLTHLTKFAIDMGTTEPIFQRPYKTPAALKSSIDKEID